MFQTRGMLPSIMALASGLLVFAACSTTYGATDPRLPGWRTNVLHGEIRSVDNRRGVISLREQRGRTEAVRYDRRTRVIYGQRQYPVTALQRGDQVRIQVAYSRNRTPIAERVDVRVAARDRGRWGGPVAGRVQSWDGTVSRVDTRRNYFTLQQNRGQALTVRVPGRLDRDDARRFQRLRRGEYVRVDVRPLGRNEAELIRFRDHRYGQPRGRPW